MRRNGGDGSIQNTRNTGDWDTPGGTGEIKSWAHHRKIYKIQIKLKRKIISNRKEDEKSAIRQVEILRKITSSKFV